MIKKIVVLAICIAAVRCTNQNADKELANKILTNTKYDQVKDKALKVVAAGFNAGDTYKEVWIRDYNTFIELSSEVFDAKELRENLLVFFRLQAADGNIVDGFIPREKAIVTKGGYTYRYSDSEPTYCGHKNTVETDQESSLVQAVYKYVIKTADTTFLKTKVGRTTVAQRMEMAMQYLTDHRWSDKYGLIYGATTADWGDVQHSHPWGVFITDETRYCVDVYDNAMMIIALDNMMTLLPETHVRWQPIRDSLAKNIMKVLWDEKNQKFIPHVYLDKSPYPDDFDENKMYYHGGTAVAIEAGLLNRRQIQTSLNKMIANVKASGAASIGLTLYPAYPEWAFENKGMYPYGYQNGGDWTWFGGRMIQQLVKYGLVKEAITQLRPMIDRVLRNDGFFEWYTIKNEPKGSGTFRGSAGVLFKAVKMLEEWAEKNR